MAAAAAAAPRRAPGPAHQPGHRPEPGRRPASGRPPLTLVRSRPAPPARAPFVLLVASILSLGLVTLLLLNTALSQGSFVLTDLQQQAAALAAREQALAQEVALKESPGRLAESAAQLGMVPNPNPVFLRLSDGTVLGEPRRATAAPTPRTSPTTGPTTSPGTGIGTVPASPQPTPATSTAPAEPAGTNGQAPSDAQAQRPTPKEQPKPPKPGAEGPADAGRAAGGEIPVDAGAEVPQ
jgi:hypothetical protein